METFFRQERSVKMESYNCESSKGKRKFYFDCKPAILGLILYFLLCTLTIAALGSKQYEQFSKNVHLKYYKTTNVNSHKKNPYYIGTPRQSPVLTQFFGWLFGVPPSFNGNSSSSTNFTLDEDSFNLTDQKGNTSQPSRTINNKGQQLSQNKKKQDSEYVSGQGHNSNLFLNRSKINQRTRVTTIKPENFLLTTPSNSSATKDERSQRVKREPYKPIKVPYTTNKNTNNLNFRSNLNNDYFSRRQLLLNPLDQQTMLALQQQQAAAAAAAVLHKHQMDTLLNSAGHRYSSKGDDYDDREDDDEDSDEDSDEFDDFHNFGGPPMIMHQHMYPHSPFQRKIGFGMRRRSVPQEESKRNRKRKHNRHKTRTDEVNPTVYVDEESESSFKREDSVSKLKSGQWLLDDYDINSDFYDKPGQRILLPQHILKQRQGSMADSEQLELDEEEHYELQSIEEEKYAKEYEKHKSNNAFKKIKDSLCKDNECLQGKDPTEIITTSSPRPSEESSVNGSNTALSNAPSSNSTGSRANTNSSSTSPIYSSTIKATPSSTPPNNDQATTTNHHKLRNCRCGAQSVRGEGLGNGTVLRNKVSPWLVQIEYDDSHACSGSIINDRYVLTSKQCVESFDASMLTVTAGILSKNPTAFSVHTIKTHPNVDIALLKLTSTINPSHAMRPICLPIGKRYAGQYSTGILITFKEGAPLQIIETELSILNNESKKGIIKAGPPGSLKCGGDTGGIFMVYRGGFSYEQIGVVSDTVGCRSNSISGAYTDIRKKTRWILNHSRDGNYCKSPVVTQDDLSSATRDVFTDEKYREAEENSEEFEDIISEEDTDEIIG